MEVYITNDYDDLSKLSADIIIKQIQKKSNSVIGFATGSTPLKTYEYLIEVYKQEIVSYKDMISFNLDEYIGLEKTNKQSYHYFMHENLFNHIDIKKENINIPQGDKDLIDVHVKDYISKLDNNPIDIQILGIGSNGHIAFNEPGTSFDSRVHVIELDKQTIEDNSRFFDDILEVPTHAITMGIKDIMNAKKIIILAYGLNKAKAIKQLLEGELTTNFPASILLDHPDVTLLIDEEAASLLEDVEED